MRCGKASSSAHKVGRTRTTEHLERVHVDIAGPMPVLSAGGREYLYVLVDDCTRAVWTRPLRLKSEVFDGDGGCGCNTVSVTAPQTLEIIDSPARSFTKMDPPWPQLARPERFAPARVLGYFSDFLVLVGFIELIWYDVSESRRSH